MDKITSSCPNCYSSFGFSISNIGDESECPECGEIFQIDPDKTADNDHYFNPEPEPNKALPYIIWGCGCLTASILFITIIIVFAVSIFKNGSSEESEESEQKPKTEESENATTEVIDESLTAEQKQEIRSILKAEKITKVNFEGSNTFIINRKKNAKAGMQEKAQEFADKINDKLGVKVICVIKFKKIELARAESP